jgi:hypothetical protein
MNHHNITLALATARVADLQRAAGSRTATVQPRRHRRHLGALVLLGLAATAALTPAPAPAQPTRDVAAAANAHVHAIHRSHHASAAYPSITFTNPLGRSRGPGAGAGLL